MLGGGALSDPQIDAMAKRFASAAESIRSQGIDPTDYYLRLGYLERRLMTVQDDAPAQMRADLETQKALELKLDERLISGRPLALPGPGDATVRFYVARGKQPDPIGVYVPQPDGAARYGLVVLLHGAQQTETDVISRGLIRRLADTRHAILIAPYHGGATSWSGSDIGDLVTLVDKMRLLFPIDGRRVYLVGMSMGGANAFHIATRDSDRFDAIMTIVGSLDSVDASLARMALRDRPVYMVSGGRDPIITPAVEANTYASLARGCVAVSQYVAPSAGHDLYAASDQIVRAWNDIFSGIVRSQDNRECSGEPRAISP